MENQTLPRNEGFHGDRYWRPGRKSGEVAMTNYISVDSVDKFAAKIEKLGGKICVPKTAVPQMGYFAVCQDTENNGFGIWENNKNAK
jgi:predicted enzyme related to lactoylglutathione lyase